ncbi:MAG: EFR1 family ferrodoxin [Pseudomonadota bacterium]
MKTAIICFSQTGNTRRVAEKIRDGILNETGQCDLLKLEDLDLRSLADYDLLGLGSPVFYLKEPFHIADFISNLPKQNSRHWFVFCSHGSVMGQALVSMTEGLEKKGALVIGFHHTYADITVPFYPKPTLTSGHPDDQDLQEAFDFGISVANCSRAVSGGDRDCIRKPLPAPEDWARKEAVMLSHEFLSQVLPRLFVNRETCLQCGQCQDACPVKGIDIGSDPIRIQEPCVYCMHCVSICPTCSIQADWSQMVSMAPGNYARYRQSLNDAKDRGEFRWLIDPDTVDCSMPLYKQREQEKK